MNFIRLLLLILLVSCGLNATQEKELNKAVHDYLDAVNQKNRLVEVAYTYPEVIQYYINLGDDQFKAKFEKAENDEEYPSFLEDPSIISMVTANDKIHIKYLIAEKAGEFYYSEKIDEKIIYAISNDDGKSWFFMDEIDYLNNDIIDEENRLIAQ